MEGEKVFHCVIADKLYIANYRKEESSFQYFATNNYLEYVPLCDDFGPMNVASVIRFVELIEDEMYLCIKNKLVYLVDEGRRSLTNGCFLIGAFLILMENYEPNDVNRVFEAINPGNLELFRDATFAPVEFGLSLIDCWRAIAKAKTFGWLCPPTGENPHWGMINVEEYEHYDNPLNGDLVQVVPGKFVAFKGPVELGSALYRDDGGYRKFGPSYYLTIFERLGVTTVVRLNERQYDESIFASHGIRHVDLQFEDCTSPPGEVVDRFLRAVDESEGLVAVHCKAGLGRTGTLIALHMMRSCGYPLLSRDPPPSPGASRNTPGAFTAREAIAWLRIMRPGSVIGEQQQFLCDYEAIAAGAPAGRRPRRSSIFACAAGGGAAAAAAPGRRRRTIVGGAGEMFDVLGMARNTAAALAGQVAAASDRRSCLVSVSSCSAAKIGSSPLKPTTPAPQSAHGGDDLACSALQAKLASSSGAVVGTATPHSQARTLLLPPPASPGVVAATTKTSVSGSVWRARPPSATPSLPSSVAAATVPTGRGCSGTSNLPAAASSPPRRHLSLDLSREHDMPPAAAVAAGSGARAAGAARAAASLLRSLESVFRRPSHPPQRRSHDDLETAATAATAAATSPKASRVVTTAAAAPRSSPHPCDGVSSSPSHNATARAVGGGFTSSSASRPVSGQTPCAVTVAGTCGVDPCSPPRGRSRSLAPTTGDAAAAAVAAATAAAAAAADAGAAATPPLCARRMRALPPLAAVPSLSLAHGGSPHAHCLTSPTAAASVAASTAAHCTGGCSPMALHPPPSLSVPTCRAGLWADGGGNLGFGVNSPQASTSPASSSRCSSSFSSPTTTPATSRASSSPSSRGGGSPGGSGCGGDAASPAWMRLPVPPSGGGGAGWLEI